MAINKKEINKKEINKSEINNGQIDNGTYTYSTYTYYRGAPPGAACLSKGKCSHPVNNFLNLSVVVFEGLCYIYPNEIEIDSRL